MEGFIKEVAYSHPRNVSLKECETSYNMFPRTPDLLGAPGFFNTSWSEVVPTSRT